MKTEITDANREVLVREIGTRYAAKLKARKIEVFDAPQFCADWIEIANRTRAPFARLEIRVLKDREFVPMNYNRIQG